ncbi:MAG: DUF896 domain-containing protein [Acutalibacteraceae bacterium]|nr:DUF896 domain-containing protein [Acutalibacteraceae bacterium]
MEQKKIDRINFLARKSREEGLTEEEKQEQAVLRREFIDSYKRSLEMQLNNTTILYEDGTKKKLTKKDS